MKITDKYVFFYGSVFSQWADTPFTENGVEFCTAEQYMMYHKATLMGDHKTANQILETSDPAVQKKLGRQITPWVQRLWDDNKYNIVLTGNLLKFSQNKQAYDFLEKYGSNRTFVEASPYDKIWGIGLAENDIRCLDKNAWEGLNLLGKVITEVYTKLVVKQ